MEYRDFFITATEIKAGPYNYQGRLAEEPWPDLLDIPTGMGKTAAVVLAWLYKRRIRKDPDTPRRLVYCLPMRVLVEQTEVNIKQWLERLEAAGIIEKDRFVVQLVIGGEDDLKSWTVTPEQETMV